MVAEAPVPKNGYQWAHCLMKKLVEEKDWVAETKLGSRDKIGYQRLCLTGSVRTHNWKKTKNNDGQLRILTIDGFIDGRGNL